MAACKSCLLIVPLALHHYPDLLRDHLGRLGYRVTLANDEYPANIVGKALGKLDSPLSRWWTRLVIRRRHLRGKSWDLILILKGRGIGSKLVLEMKQTGARVVGYHYDALGYDRASRAWGQAVDRVTKFDYRDAEEQSWPLVRLFAANPPRADPARQYRLSAVLRNHSDRLWYLDRVLPEIGPGKIFVYIYEKDVFTFLHNLAKNPARYWRWRKHIHFRPLAYESFETVLSQSEYTLDYAHPTQTGATMRSVEAMAAATRLITNNARLTDDPMFPGDSVVVFTGTSPVGELSRRMSEADRHSPEAFRRTPMEFLSEIIGEVDRPVVSQTKTPAGGPAGASIFACLKDQAAAEAGCEPSAGSRRT